MPYRFSIRTDFQALLCLLTGILMPLSGASNVFAFQDEAPTPAAEEPACDLQAQFSIVNELVTQADLDDHRRKSPDIDSALSSGNLRGNARDLIEYSAKIRVGELSRVTLREEGELPETRQKLLRYVDFRAKGQSKAYFLQQLTTQAEKLLDNHIQVRLQAIFLLRGLNAEPANLTKGLPPVPYVGAFNVLLKVVEDPCQMDAVKIAAITGLNRICQDAQPKVEQRYRYSTALISELNAANVHPWLQEACVRGLGAVDYLYDSDRKPVVVQELMKIVRDTKRLTTVRSEAARSLGQCPLDSSLNVELIVHDIVKLSRDMSVKYNSSREKRLMTADFFRVYLTFRPIDEQAQKANHGLIRQASQAKLRTQKNRIDSAYRVVLPACNVVFSSGGKKIDDGTLKAITKWLADNKPANTDQVASNLPKLP